MTPRRQFIVILALGVAFLVLFRQLEPTGYQMGLLMRCMILMIVTTLSVLAFDRLRLGQGSAGGW